MKNFLFAILLLIVLVACRNDGYNLNIQTNGDIVIIDSILLTNNFESYNPDNIQSGYYPIYYIGNKKDTITLRKERYEYNDFNYIDTLKDIFTANAKNVSIEIDTNFKTSVDVKFKHYIQQKESQQIDSVFCYAGYTFIVSNLTDSALYLGSGKGSIGNVYLQVINEDGNWVDYEKPYHYSCSVGFQCIVLCPKQLLIGKLIRKRGDYKTKCRLKFKVNDNIIYSNFFEDWIDKRQLKFNFSESYEK